MRDLSLHILDLVENSIRAGASQVDVTVAEDSSRDLLTVSIEDNGSGLKMPPELAADPFFTTKAGKRTGLGLSLFVAAAEHAGGSATLGEVSPCGVRIEARMQLSHVDRSPLGDLAAAISSIVCTNPGLELRCRLVVGDRAEEIRVSEVAGGMPSTGLRGLAVARKMSDGIRKAIETLGVSA